MKIRIDHFVREIYRNRQWRHSVEDCRQTLPRAVDFYEQLMRGAPDAHDRIDLVFEPKLIYLQNPKVASTAIRRVLAEISGKKNTLLLRHKKGVYGNPPRMQHVGLKSFYQLACDPQTLVFSFVRNPYDRLISAWANKFAQYALVPSSYFGVWRPVVDTYLNARAEIDPSLPSGPNAYLSFPQFVRYACATASTFVEKHIYLQTQIVGVPGLTPGLIGKYESFQLDLEKLYDHINLPAELRQRLFTRVNRSVRTRCKEYFTQDLADQVYRAYESDFDAFHYPRALPD